MPESITEDREAMRPLLKTVEPVLKTVEPAFSQLLLPGGNTSSRFLEALAGSLHHPSPFVDLNLLDPATETQTVDVVRAPAASRKSLAHDLAFAGRFEHSPQPLRCSSGCLLNCTFASCIPEAVCRLEEGADPELIDRTMVDFSMPSDLPEPCTVSGNPDPRFLASSAVGWLFWLELWQDKRGKLNLANAFVAIGRMGPWRCAISLRVFHHHPSPKPSPAVNQELSAPANRI